MGTKRPVEAFGKDTSGMKSLDSARKGAGAFGKQTDARPSLSDEPKGGSKRRPVRAWGYLPRASVGGLMQDHARTSEATRQNYNEGEVACNEKGGNSTGRTMKAVQPYIVDEFQGRSGQPDNQATSRPKGST